MTGTMTAMTCPHCAHPWASHANRCTQCGCMWTNPANAPKPPPPPTAREQLIANIENTIWTELEHQHHAETPFPPYVDQEMDTIDGQVNMTAVAAAVADLFVNSEDDCSWCHNPCAIDGWKQPLADEPD